MKYLYFILWSILFSISVYAERPFDCEKSSYTLGQTLYVVGIAVSATEAEARNKAFENGKNEIKNFFQKDLLLPAIETQRTYSEKTPEGYYVCRILKVDLSKIDSTSFGFMSTNVIGDPTSSEFYKVKILSNPSDAALIFGNSIVGRTDAVLMKVSKGSHKLIIQKEGYQPIEETIQVDADKAFSFNLNKKKTKVIITNDAGQGQIFINGKFYKDFSSTDEELELEVLNSYTIKLVSPNHVPDEKQFYINPNDSEVVKNFHLQGHPGKITITSEPIGADILIDGKDYGKTPQTITLAPKLYQLTLSMENFYNTDQGFELKAGDTKTLPIVTMNKFSAKKYDLENSPWILSVFIGYGGAPIKEDDLSSMIFGMAIEKRIIKKLGLKFDFTFSYGLGGEKIDVPNSDKSYNEKELTGFEGKIGVPLYIKDFYLSPGIGLSSYKYDYNSLSSTRTTAANVDYSINTKKATPTPYFFSLEAGYSYFSTVSFPDCGFVLNMGLNKYSDSKGYHGNIKLYGQGGFLFRF